jgi:hypothetical protein
MSLSLPSQTFELARHWSPVFVETGTHVGGGVLGAVVARFERIYTCDIDGVMLTQAQHNMGTQFERVRYFLGDSAKCLPEMLSLAGKQAVILLDAHDMGDTPQAKACPLRDELETLRAYGRNGNDIIMVDDVDLCGTPRLGNITLDEVKERILRLNGAYKFRLLDGLTRPKMLLFAAPHEFNH